MNIKRQKESEIFAHFQAKTPKPLVLRGARQVGKSTLAADFAKHSGLELFEINLEKHRELDLVFATLDVRRIVRELEAVAQKRLNPNNSLLFLDEIQAAPHSIAALRYFYEELSGLKVIATGSLLEFVLKEHSFSMPVGRVQYLHLGPLIFSEFLSALGEDWLFKVVSEFEPGQEISSTDHERLCILLREYLLIGGMPEAVNIFRQDRDFQAANRAQRSILETYQDDFSKYASSEQLVRLQTIFRKVPQEIGRKVKYVNLSREISSREVRGALDLLLKAKVLSAAYHSDCSGLPLAAGSNDNSFKLFFLDVGLAVAQLGLDWKALSALDAPRLINEGALAEQFIGQHLLDLSSEYSSPELTYWLREGKSTNAEVDFVISRGDAIIPIEVKAGASGTLRSLHQFCAAKHPKFAIRFDLNLPSIQRVSSTTQHKQGASVADYTLYSLPLYLVAETNRLVEKIRETAKS